MSTLDLITASGIRSHLENTPFSSDHVTKLNGGFGNYTYRLHLHTPYCGHQTLVLKHAKPYVAANKEIPFEVKRQTFEAEALRRIKDWLPANCVVTVPIVHLYDEEANIIIMDDCGTDSFTLKELAKDIGLAISLASEIGTALGEFLRRFHTWGKHNQSLIDFFGSNQQAKNISAWATYGRLVSTLTGEDQLDSLPLPLENVSESQLGTISQLAAEKISALTSSSDSFVMGDFWPGNILISLSSDQTCLHRIYIIDWELAKPGIPGTDIGQFCAELSLLRWFHPHSEASVSKLMTAFLESYRYSNNIDISLCRDAIVHTGAHLVAWTPRVNWGSREQTTEVVEEGVNYLIQGWTGNFEWLKASPLGPLLA